jgi:hypothetical protein
MDEKTMKKLIFFRIYCDSGVDPKACPVKAEEQEV